jgi:alkylated DNA repair dioxygenase AlkB
LWLEGEKDKMIPGLRYIPHFITDDEGRELVRAIDSQPCLPALKRRTQHYGYRYNYTKRAIDASSKLGELPEWLGVFSDLLFERGLFEENPNQVIVNEYMLGQGIQAHIDATVFGKTVASLSSLSSIDMYFEKYAGLKKHSVLLEPESLLVLKGPARYDWKHSIPVRVIDTEPGGVKIVRGRRISITFRTVPK